MAENPGPSGPVGSKGIRAGLVLSSTRPLDSWDETKLKKSAAIS